MARESHLSRGGGIGLTTRSPYIEPFQYNNTTVFVGQSAYITCIVHNLGDKTVRSSIIISFPFKADFFVWP